MCDTSTAVTVVPYNWYNESRPIDGIGSGVAHQGGLLYIVAMTAGLDPNLDLADSCQVSRQDQALEICGAADNGICFQAETCLHA